MGSNSKEQEFARTWKNIFERSVAAIDADTLAELQRRRRRALGESRRTHPRWIYYPAGALVAVCLAVVVYTFTANPATHPLNPEDLDILSRAEGLEFYEDLEFYEWLAEYDLST